MRRQARISAGGALVVRSASALQVWLWLLLFVFQNEFRISRSIQPGYLDFDNLPETNFTCTGKVIGGYYADLETSCQMFHVCTVGQQDEPMDIKFLCLNGTVFDQETRVCERVDEVDCTKSEKFYSLNLELYGSTAPPIIQPDQTKPTPKPTEQSHLPSKPSTTDASDPFANDSTTSDKNLSSSVETIDSTEDPIQDVKKDEQKVTSTYPPLPSKEEELSEDYEEDAEAIDSEGPEYDEEYSRPQLTTTTIQTITTTTSTTTRRPTTNSVLLQSTTHQTFAPYLNSSPSPSISSLAPVIHSTYTPSPPSSTLDPALLSPQEFIYRHRGPGSEAISFQRQSFRPADGVYITHAPQHQYDHFQYESSRTAPRPVAPRPVPFVQRPQPTPFRPTTIDPRDQMLRPGSNSAPSDRLESAIKHRPQPFPSHLPPQQSLPFNPFYYDRKRSDDIIPENESTLSARSVAPPTVKEKRLPKPKSPPRVIVTASASVSDSNGKRLNYTVGNVVSAVKPIVPINYDDYKESDLLFDPFFLDVPKLQARRKTRSSKYRKVVTVPALPTISAKVTTDTANAFSSVALRATTTEVTSTSTSTTTAAWNPEDYVDDNYEPHAYIPPIPPLAVLVTNDQIMYKKQERPLINDVAYKKIKLRKEEISQKEQPKPTLSIAHTISSQSVGTEATAPATSPTPIEAPACVTSRSTNCRIRA